ncbi:hypothetical protein RJ640_000060 [Escallonia rubra]|uniref:Uncharacterized protein n=1 Tax=Escallonia rubra TaxID=112253 RepID=A0AA88RSX5_9ASTE|nr:hypothetical protein RJ640_000060 [Escallonia rubra]
MGVLCWVGVNRLSNVSKHKQKPGCPSLDTWGALDEERVLQVTPTVRGRRIESNMRHVHSPGSRAKGGKAWHLRTQTLTSQSEVSPYNPQSSQPLLPRNELGELRDKAEDKDKPQPLFMVDDKRNKMTKKELETLLKQNPLLGEWISLVPELQEPANYGTDWVICIHEEQLRSGYRLHLHPFTLKNVRPLQDGAWLACAQWLEEVVAKANNPCDLKRTGMPTMHSYDIQMLSRFEMAREVAAHKGQEKREVIAQTEEVVKRAQKLTKRETNLFGQVEVLEKRLERARKKAVEARDQGIQDYLDGNAGNEWLKKCTEDSLKIYKKGFLKANEICKETIWSAVTPGEIFNGDGFALKPGQSIVLTPLLDGLVKYVVELVATSTKMAKENATPLRPLMVGETAAVLNVMGI